MDTRNGLLNFTIFILLFAFSFVLGNDALSAQNTLYGVFAVLGYTVGIALAFFNGIMARRAGEALAIWYLTYAVVVSIVFVWFLTRVGTAFGLW